MSYTPRNLKGIIKQTVRCAMSRAKVSIVCKDMVCKRIISLLFVLYENMNFDLSKFKIERYICYIIYFNDMNSLFYKYICL